MRPLQPHSLDLWVLAGQSNMVGRPPLVGALQSHPHVWNFSSAGIWEPAIDPLHRLWESFTPVHQRLMRASLSLELRSRSDSELAGEERAEKSGAGLGLSFSIAMHHAHGRSIGLIPCAHGGTSLEEWSPAHDQTGANSLYSGMLERIRRARTAGTIKGILWYQGESDSMRQKDAESYGQRFKQWIETARTDIGLPGLPVIAVQVGRVDNPAFLHADLVREALRQLPAQLQGTAVTSAIDLAIVDECHVSTHSLIRLGRRLARAALHLTDQPDVAPGPQVSSIRAVPGDLPHYHCVDIALTGVAGRLNPIEHVSGFSVSDTNADAGTPVKIWNADTRPTNDHPTGDATIRLHLSRPVTVTTHIAYGQGVAPYCNIVDDADMPLCAFAPRQVTLP